MRTVWMQRWLHAPVSRTGPRALPALPGPQARGRRRPPYVDRRIRRLAELLG
jgi:hypothetical protein